MPCICKFCNLPGTYAFPRVDYFFYMSIHLDAHLSGIVFERWRGADSSKLKHLDKKKEGNLITTFQNS